MLEECKIFMDGQSQAVRLPKGFDFKSQTVFINKVGNVVMIVPADNPWRNMIEACDEFTVDVFEHRDSS